jgi:hypothetical protein
MNRYSLSSPSRLGWVPSGLAGLLALTGVTLVLAVPVVGAPGEPAGSEPAPVLSTVVERPCFLVRAVWNIALDNPQPVCTTTLTAPEATATPLPRAAVRPWMDTLP